MRVVVLGGGGTARAVALVEGAAEAPHIRYVWVASSPPVTHSHSLTRVSSAWRCHMMHFHGQPGMYWTCMHCMVACWRLLLSSFARCGRCYEACGDRCAD